MTQVKPIRPTVLRLHNYATAPHFSVRLSRWLSVVLVLTLVGLALVPWQQTVEGAGRVVAYSPTEREQELHAPVPGRIVKWHVVEGSQVRAGDPIVELADIDPDYVDRIEQRLAADRDRIEAARQRLTVYEAQVEAYEKARTMNIQALQMRVKMAAQKVSVAQQKVDVASATLETTTSNWERVRGLEEKGIASKRQREVAELEFRQSEAQLSLAQAEFLEAQAAMIAAQAEVGRADAEGGAKVASSLAEVEKAQSEAAYARGDVVKLEVERSRQLAQVIRSPVDGTIVHIDGNLGGNVVKSGQSLARLVPETKSRAVELYVDGNDAPLIAKGRRVRLQFEGWPALQFSGFPSVAVGTYGGVVTFVNPAATDDRGRVRVLVVPDKSDRPWPEASLLRQQVRARSWFLLDSVKLGWEVWRRLNGFPPTLEMSPAKKATEKPDLGEILVEKGLKNEGI